MATYTPVLYSSHEEQRAAAHGLAVAISIGAPHEATTYTGAPRDLLQVMERLHGSVEAANPYDMDTEALGAWYAEVVGYNPFEDFKAITLEEVQELADGIRREIEASRDPRQGGR